MIDYDVLKKYGTHNSRLRDMFTATMPEDVGDWTQEEKDAKQKDIDNAKKLQTLIGDRLQDQIAFSLKNSAFYSSVDLAGDSAPINKSIIPLMLYAQGKLDLGACASSLNSCGFGQYVEKDDKGNVKNIDFPKFFEVNVNIIRSVIGRRLAAQANKYAKLYPYLKYESRSTSLVGKIRGDIMSQVVEKVVDDYDWRHHDVQVERDMLLYAQSVDFVRSSWEKEIQVRKKPYAPGLEPPKDQKPEDLEVEDVIVKEGLVFVNPHPSRIFWDNAYPLSSINSDSGCEYIGYWDVCRYRDVALNPMYWNRKNVSFNVFSGLLFSTYANYFSQYYCTIKPPTMANNWDLAGTNDRKNNVSLYSGNQEDTSMLFATMYMKITPNDYGIGTYPYPVWIRFITGGDNTVLFAEIMPSTPAAVAAYNCNDSRQVNVSLAHELMPYQDQMTNLFSSLLLTLKGDSMRILVVDLDSTTPEQIKVFREQIKGEKAYSETTVLEVSRSKLRELGVDPTRVIEMVQATRSNAIDIIFKAIAQLIEIMERLMALSAHEQGRATQHEVSATESVQIEATTEAVYGFISGAIDEFRAAKKRIFYESYMAKGNQNLRLPVINRYTTAAIKKAGFEVVDDESEDLAVLPGPQRHTVIGTREMLEHDYIFTTRDGAERPVNTQAANVMVQLLGVLKDPVIMAALGKERLYEIVNEIFRQSGAGLDLNLELQEGEDNNITPPAMQQLQQEMPQIQTVLEQLTAAVEKNTQNIAAIMQVFPVPTGVEGGQPQQQAAA